MQILMSFPDCGTECSLATSGKEEGHLDLEEELCQHVAAQTSYVGEHLGIISPSFRCSKR